VYCTELHGARPGCRDTIRLSLRRTGALAGLPSSAAGQDYCPMYTIYRPGDISLNGPGDVATATFYVIMLSLPRTLSAV
jgi:hypothetical protein